MYGEFIMLVNSQKLKNCRKQKADQKPTGIVVDWYVSIVPFPKTQFYGGRLHKKIKYNGKQGSVKNEGKIAHPFFNRSVGHSQSAYKFSINSMGSNTVAIDNDKPV